MSELLHQAIIDGDVDGVAQVLNSGISPDAKFKLASQPPLCMALECGHEDIAMLLLEAGADFNQSDAFSYSEHMKEPIHYAAAHASIMVLDWLLEHGIHVDTQDYTMITPLHYAASYGHEDVVRWLVEKGADVNHRSKSGRTALWKAAERGHATIVTYLHSVHAEVNVQNLLGEALLCDCIEMPSMVKLLISLGADINLRDISGQHVLHVAAMIGPPQTIKVLLEAGASPNVHEELNNTPLHVAAIHGHCDIVRCLLNGGAYVNKLNQARISAFNLALRHNHIKLTDMLHVAGCRLSAVEIKDLDRHFRRGYQQLSQLIQLRHEQIRSLKNISMLAIRTSLNKDIEEKVIHLSLPNAIKHYVTLQDY